MSSIIKVMLLDEASILVLFHLFKIGIVHPVSAPGTVKGIIIGFWRLEIQLILGFWNKSALKENMYHA
mgnify:CR=1 FL=1|tara:strand:+ start:254 stop:457 length:204 start_codon:yes stop_codon:yes gene_type:complete